MAKIVNPEIQALGEVVQILEPLNHESQARILDYLTKLYVVPALKRQIIEAHSEQSCNFPGYGHAPAGQQATCSPMQTLPAPQASVTFERLPPDQVVPGPQCRPDQFLPSGMPGGPGGITVESLDEPR